MEETATRNKETEKFIVCPHLEIHEDGYPKATATCRHFILAENPDVILVLCEPCLNTILGDTFQWMVKRALQDRFKAVFR